MEKVKDLHPQSGNKVYRDQIVTLADLQVFKEDLLLSIKTLIQNNNSQPVKKWLKSYEVKKLLNISPGTLQTLRSNGTLPYTRIGGMIYYEVEENSIFHSFCAFRSRPFLVSDSYFLF